jgi:cyclin-dependent kinase
MEEEGVPSTTLREVSLLQMLSESNHVVKLLCVEHLEENGKPCLYLVFEYLSTDLKKYMDRNGKGPANPLDPMLVKSIMYQLIKGVAHMHKLGVMHRDLKPQNMLVDDTTAHPLVKVADLGLGRHFSIPIKAYTHEIVTLWYRAPEVLLGCTHYAPAVDIWSVACIFAELARKQAIFPGDSELQQLLHIFKMLGTPSEKEWPGVSKLRDWHEFPQWKAQDLTKIFPRLCPAGIDLMKQMFEYDPAKRITAKDSLVHSYFDDLDKVMIDAMENPTLVAREAADADTLVI